MNKYCLITLLLLIVACDKKEDPTLIQTDSRAILDECRQQTLTTSEIKENLPGNWELIDFGCTHCVIFHEPQIFIAFSESTGTMQYSTQDVKDSILDFTWTVQIDSLYDDIILTTDPPNQILNALRVFCKNYMYFDFRAGDGGLYLFEKQ